MDLLLEITSFVFVEDKVFIQSLFLVTDRSPFLDNESNSRIIGWLRSENDHNQLQSPVLSSYTTYLFVYGYIT